MITLMVWSARVAFFVMLIGLTVIALALPESRTDIGRFIPWDKAAHFIAYFSIAVTGFVAFPRIPAMFLLSFLLAQSAFVEALQPYFGRERDVLDLLANFIGLVAAYSPVIAYKLRELAKKPPRTISIFSSQE